MTFHQLSKLTYHTIGTYTLRLGFALGALAIFISPAPLELTPKVHAAQIALSPTHFASITFSKAPAPASQKKPVQQTATNVEANKRAPASKSTKARTLKKHGSKDVARMPQVANTQLKQETLELETKETVTKEAAANETANEDTSKVSSLETTISKLDTTNEVALVKQPLFREAPTAPYYPPLARRRGIEGTVILEVWLDEYGQQTDLRIHQSSGKDVLDVSAVQAVENWRFQAHSINGLNVASRVQIPVRFALN